MSNNKLIKEINELMKKPEMWIGIAVVVVFITLSTILVVKQVKKQTVKKTVAEKIISPIITITPNATPSATLVKETNKLKTVVKKLADTTGEIDYQVENGDSYWKIAKKVCGVGNYFENIQTLNQNQDLHEGNTIKVICE